MNDALSLFYYILNKCFNFLFSSYLFDGVSIGMLFVCTFVFVVLLNALLAVPRFIERRNLYVKRTSKSSKVK